jgi:gluconate 2-dehydrogenase alpha chain
MTRKLKEVDAVLVGMGWTGSIMARELAKAGLSVVGLERGMDRKPSEAFALPGVRDELRYALRQELMLDPAVQTVTLRHDDSQTAWAAWAPIGTARPTDSCPPTISCARI